MNKLIENEEKENKLSLQKRINYYLDSIDLLLEKIKIHSIDKYKFFDNKLDECYNESRNDIELFRKLIFLNNLICNYIDENKGVKL